MRRVLFVDDDPNVLHGLKRMLRSKRCVWQVEIAESGMAALEAIEREPFDVVVSDMKMPRMDGAELLSEVRKLHPEAVRIILSGYSEKEGILKCIGSAHRYLSKPCDPAVLTTTLDRIETLSALLGNESIRSLVSQAASLPSLETLFQQIAAELQKSNASVETIGHLIAQDIGMSCKILQLVNSSCFGLSRRMTTVAPAVKQLGLETINSLVLSVSVFSKYDGARVPEFSIDSLWHHSMRTAAFAKVVAQAENAAEDVVDDAFMAGVLHDVGKLVLAGNAPERYGQALQRARNGLSVCEAEKAVLNATHAQIGAYLIGLWGLPESIVQAIAYHARPKECPVAVFGVPTIVHVASGLDRELNAVDDDTDSSQPIDLEHLTSLGLEERLPVWRKACREVLEEGVHQ